MTHSTATERAGSKFDRQVFGFTKNLGLDRDKLHNQRYFGEKIGSMGIRISNGIWAQLGVRATSWWLPKQLMFIVGMPAFFVVYFVLLRYPLFQVTEMPITLLDRLIGFRAWALIPYASLWVYVPFAPGLLLHFREVVAYYCSATLMSVAGMTAFLFWPTSTPPATVEWALHPSFGFLKTVDAAGNACPSMHAAFAALTLLLVDDILRKLPSAWLLRLINLGWCLAILYSTVATKQHVVVDVLTGIALATAVALIHLKWLSPWVWTTAASKIFKTA